MKKNQILQKVMSNKVPTVHELRKKGWKVRVGHHRKFYRFCSKTGKKNELTLLWKEQKANYPEYYLEARGGHTTITIKCPFSSEEVVGVSECSEKDLYNKKVGTKKAIARALAKISFPDGN